jgi:predicted ATPase/DNA-binding winged helix-turn-helix (wHTH) protein
MIKVSDQSGPAGEVTFGPFRLFPARELLLEGDKPLHLGSRALEILKALIERPGTLVTKEDLVARVWPTTFVEEGSLRVHMAALRRALADGQAGKQYIITIPGRGYRFVAPVSSLAGSQTSGLQSAAQDVSQNLPSLLTRIVGRDVIVEALVSQLPQCRFITIAGPGGIGKTTVAMAVANKVSASYRDGARFVDLAPVSDPLHVPSAVASVLGVAIHTASPLSELVAALKDKQMLLVLDSCEHVIDAAASLAEEALRAGHGIHILATSREAMRAEGERVHRLGPLDVPPVSGANLTAADALTYPAVQLFVERANVNLSAFELTDADILIIAEICRRLDGIALAIELAAGQVETFGVKGLATRLDDRLRLLTRGRRTALPRHQTLSATLDWSYEFLPEREQALLRQLAIFAGAFTLEPAQAIGARADIEYHDFEHLLANLVAKSLVTADVGGAVVFYRLLETTREYGLAKLRETGEIGLLQRRHAEYFLNLFERAATESEIRPPAEWLAIYGRRIDNVRAALDWAFSLEGDDELGIALTIAALPLWTLLSLMEECRSRAQRALATLGPVARPATRQTMTLLAAMAAALRYDKGSGSGTEAAWTEALAIAEHLDDADYQLRSLSGLRTVRLSEGNLREAFNLARRFKDVAPRTADPKDLVVGDRMIGFALHLLGDQVEARRHMENVLRHVGPTDRAHIIRFGYDQRVMADNTLAVILWLQGLPDQAMQIAERNIDYAQALNHQLSLCNALSQCAGPVALLVGDTAAAERYVAMLLDRSDRHALRLWHASGRCLDGVLRIRQGDAVAGLTTLRGGLDDLPATSFVTCYLFFLAELAEALCQAGEIANGRAAIDAALDRCQRNEELWYLPELQRIKGEVLLREMASDANASAETEFLRSLDLARRQQVLSWELRTTTSLARLWRKMGRRSDARDQLASVYGRFTEGFGTADLRAAKQILDELATEAAQPP